LKNTRQLIKLNPYAEVTRRRALLAKEKKKFEDQIKTAEKKKKTLPKGHPAALYLKNAANRLKLRTKANKARLVRVEAKKKAVAAKKAKKAAAKK
jgi:large subunit ribosomal protein L4e